MTFVGVVGHLHGSCPEGCEQSCTEREFEAAVEEKKPRLMFLATEEFAVPMPLRESDERYQRQRAFREKASAARIRDTFTKPDELATKVVKAIRNWEQRQTPERQAAPEATIPLPPQPWFAHPYPLQSNFTGRLRERQMLTEWLGGDENVLAVIAIGGMGKSALTWAWVVRDVLGLPLPGTPADALCCRVADPQRPEGVLWWSFYEEKSSFRAFVERALVYAGVGAADPKQIPSMNDRLNLLGRYLQQRRLLLILDGFERELRAYTGLNAAYQGDEPATQQQDDFRACVDPAAEAFLRGVASLPMASRVLLTSRLMPRDLEDVAGCKYEELVGLDPDDAFRFFEAQGVNGTRAEVVAACEPYGYHPLALRLLAGVIVNDKRKPGEIRVADKHPVTDELKGKEQHHILQVAYDQMDKPKRELLSRLSAFRSPMDYDAMEVMSRFRKEGKLDSVLDELTARGLLFFDREHARYDLHPVVRKHAYDRLTDPKGVHSRLRDYFEAIPAPDEDKIESVDDLAPVIELYHHTLHAGSYDEAMDLCYHRLWNSLYFRFGAYQTCIDLLRGLFPDGEGRPPRLQEERAQAWTLSALGVSYSRSGRSRRAVCAHAERYSGAAGRQEESRRRSDQPRHRPGPTRRVQGCGSEAETKHRAEPGGQERIR